ncbi:MAG: DUF975 family protein, partial [Verrucomicrobia bacterium]|nr:DUF975 family protein [Verrucomicrobiota bacterium]
QIISTICTELQCQPLVMNMQAYMAGNMEEALTYVPENVTPLKTTILVIAQIVSICLEYGYFSYCLHAARRQKCAVLDLMDGFLVVFRAVVLRMVIIILISIGFSLFIVPGLLLAYTYSMAPKLLLDHPDWSPFRCMRESRWLMKGHKKEFFVLRLTLIFWNIMAMFPLTAVFARPYSTFSETEFYLDLTGTNVPDIEEEPPEEKPPWEY